MPLVIEPAGIFCEQTGGNISISVVTYGYICCVNVACMDVNHYDYTIGDDFLTFEFCSEGPKGRIKKLIEFKLMTPGLYNLGFGDFCEGNRIFDDIVVSNNNDTERVLVTVAHAAIAFTNIFPDRMIYVEGSTPARTRRYQMGINKYWKEIEPLFEVYGQIKSGVFESFTYGRNYSSFVAIRKNRNLDVLK